MCDNSGIDSVERRLHGIGVTSTSVPLIEEVNIFKDETIIQILNPKVEASVGANMWVTGSSQTKKLQDILPGIINQLGPDNLEKLRKLAEQFQKQAAAATSAQEADDTFEAAAAAERQKS